MGPGSGLPPISAPGHCWCGQSPPSLALRARSPRPAATPESCRSSVPPSLRFSCAYTAHVAQLRDPPRSPRLVSRDHGASRPRTQAVGLRVTALESVPLKRPARHGAFGGERSRRAEPAVLWPCEEALHSATAQSNRRSSRSQTLHMKEGSDGHFRLGRCPACCSGSSPAGPGKCFSLSLPLRAFSRRPVL